jgi:hypothetical protein
MTYVIHPTPTFIAITTLKTQKHKQIPNISIYILCFERKRMMSVKIYDKIRINLL